MLFKAKQNWRRFFSTANICRILLAFPLKKMFTLGHHTSTWASLKKFYLFWVKTLGVTFVCRKMTQKSENKVFPAFLYFQDWKNFQVVAGMISINNQSRSSFSCLPLDKGIWTLHHASKTCSLMTSNSILRTQDGPLLLVINFQEKVSLMCLQSVPKIYCSDHL